jgi:hypothetical protein
MARKRRPGGDGPRRRRRAEPTSGNRPDLPDRRTLERALRQLVGRADPATPQGQAEELVAQAFEAGDPQQQVGLARGLACLVQVRATSFRRSGFPA